MASWTDLPNEIKHMIVNEVADRPCRFGLCSFRLVSRECRSLSETQFAKQNFTSRRHAICKDSLEDLVDISKHPIFAPYLKTIQLSAIENFLDDTEGLTPCVYYVTFDIGEAEVFKPLLRQALVNLKAFRAQISIGLSRKWAFEEGVKSHGCYGWNPKFAHRKGVNDDGRLEDTTWAHIAENERIVFQVLISVIEEINLPVKSLCVKLIDHSNHPTEGGCKEPCSQELVENIFRYLARSPGLTAKVQCAMESVAAYRYESIDVKYNRHGGGLSILKTDLEVVHRFMHSWISSVDLRKLKLLKMKIKGSQDLRRLIGTHMGSLESFGTGGCKTRNAEKFREILRFLSNMPALQDYWIHRPSIHVDEDGKWSEFHFGNVHRRKLFYSGNVQRHLLAQMRV